jgi:hypothetical protein
MEQLTYVTMLCITCFKSAITGIQRCTPFQKHKLFDFSFHHAFLVVTSHCLYVHLFSIEIIYCHVF